MDGGVDQGVREGLAWRGKAGCTGAGLVDGGSGRRGKGSGGGARASVFLTRTKRRKMAVFEGCPVGWRGGTHRSWPGGRGGRPRALIPGEGVRGGWLGGATGWVSTRNGGSGRRVVETRAPGTEQISQRVSYFCCF